jgi:A/G-specific adenine glycosylase
VKKKKAETIHLSRDVAVISDGKAVLVRQEKLGKVMGGLYEFPYVTQGESWPFQFTVRETHPLSSVKHSFTKYRATLYPSLWKVTTREEVSDYEWVTWEQVLTLPFSSGHRRILKEMIASQRVK